MNIFYNDGQFGSRYMNGQDSAAPRYISSSLENWANIAWNKKVVGCIDKRSVEGHKVEPLFIPSVIPWHVINGANGMATGYSTRIPAHNPYDVVEWLRQRCFVKDPNDVEIQVLPWYKGFKGILEVYNVPRRINFQQENEFSLDHRTQSNAAPDESCEEDVEDENPRDDAGWEDTPIYKSPKLCSYGLFDVLVYYEDSCDIIIDELPIGICLDFYKRKILNVWIEKKLIKSYSDNGVGDEIKLTLFGVKKDDKEIPLSINGLKLSKTLTMSNMTLCDLHGVPKHFNNVGEILEAYFTVMISTLELYKVNVLNQKREEIDGYDQKYRLVMMFLNGILKIGTVKNPVSINEWYAFTDADKIDRKVVDSLAIKEITKEFATKLEEKIVTLKEEISEIEKTSTREMYIADLNKFEKEVLIEEKYPRSDEFKKTEAF